MDRIFFADVIKILSADFVEIFITSRQFIPAYLKILVITATDTLFHAEKIHLITYKIVIFLKKPSDICLIISVDSMVIDNILV